MRERLLDAADSLLFAEGAVTVPVDVILKEAGASPNSLYAQFGNKNGLIAAALERRFDEWSAAWDAALEGADGAEERALSVFEALRIYQRNHLTERWCAFSGTAASTPSPTERIEAILGRETGLLRERFHELAAEVCGEEAADGDGATSATRTQGASPATDDTGASGSHGIAGRTEALAADLMFAYNGTLTMMLREPWEDAVAAGESVARRAIRAARAR